MYDPLLILLAVALSVQFIALDRNMTVNMRQNLSMPEFEGWLRSNFLTQVFKNNSAEMEQLHALYPVAQFPNDTHASRRGPLFRTPYDAAMHLLGDYWATCTQRRSAYHYWEAQQKLPSSEAGSIYLYFYAHVPTDKRQCRGWLKVPPTNEDGTCHSSELAYAYGDYSYAHTQEETRLIYVLSNYWTNIAITRDPNVSPSGRERNATIPPLPGHSSGQDVAAAGKLPLWKPYAGPPEHGTQILGGGRGTGTRPSPHMKQCDFWDKHLPSSGWK